MQHMDTIDEDAKNGKCKPTGELPQCDCSVLIKEVCYPSSKAPFGREQFYYQYLHKEVTCLL